MFWNSFGGQPYIGLILGFSSFSYLIGLHPKGNVLMYIAFGCVTFSIISQPIKSIMRILMLLYRKISSTRKQSNQKLKRFCKGKLILKQSAQCRHIQYPLFSVIHL